MGCVSKIRVNPPLVEVLYRTLLVLFMLLLHSLLMFSANPLVPLIPASTSGVSCLITYPRHIQIRVSSSAIFGPFLRALNTEILEVLRHS